MATVPSAEALRLAESALDEVAPVGAVGEVVDADDEQGVLALRYRSLLSGYPDWFWTVTLAEVDGQAHTVLEVALLPGTGSLVAPEWVPWADRLADYLAAKESSPADDEDGVDDAEVDDASGVRDFGDFDETDLASDEVDDGLDFDDQADGAASDDADGAAAGR